MKDGATKTKTAKSTSGAAKPPTMKSSGSAGAAAAKGAKESVKSAAKSGKGAAAIPAGKAGKDAKSGKAAAGKKPAVPPAPARKIQVVQLTTLKPGARGTKASVAHRAVGDATVALPLDAEKSSAAAKKRRSAELTPQQLAHFRELLSTRRARLNSDLSMMQDEALKVTAQDNSSDSVADTGTDNYEQDFTLGLIESEEALAREVDAALVRLDQNAFGVCEACQTPVPLARLEILPFARHCVECQQKREGKS